MIQSIINNNINLTTLISFILLIYNYNIKFNDISKLISTDIKKKTYISYIQASLIEYLEKKDSIQTIIFLNLLYINLIFSVLHNYNLIHKYRYLTDIFLLLIFINETNKNYSNDLDINYHHQVHNFFVVLFVIFGIIEKNDIHKIHRYIDILNLVLYIILTNTKIIPVNLVGYYSELLALFNLYLSRYLYKKNY